MEVYNYFYILLLIVCFVFLGIDCFELQEYFESLADVEIHNPKLSLPIFLEPKDGD